MLRTHHSNSKEYCPFNMDCIKPPTSSDSNKTKISWAFSKCIHPQTPSRFAPNHGLGKLNKSQEFSLKEAVFARHKTQRSNASDEQQAAKSRAAKETLIAKIFASLSSIKAAYAELQTAQFPYNSGGIEVADQAIVHELSMLSELKQKYLSKALDLPPLHVTRLLAEIQEQQSNIKTYEITVKQMESKIDQKDSEISSLKKRLEDAIQTNKSLEKKLNFSGSLPILGNIPISELNHCHFTRVLHYAVKSLRHFVKQLVGEMEAKNWDSDSAAKAVEPNVFFPKARHKVFAFESFICRVMFDGFNHENFMLSSDQVPESHRHLFYEKFKKMQTPSGAQILSQNPGCKFAKFCRAKYLKLVHPKMECSFFGNLDQRKIVSSGAFPGSEFFAVFAEMARRIWLLHCLAFSFDPPAVAFQVKRGCRFSEVYMESVADCGLGGDIRVAFTVVPGFKIGKTVIQSQVYLSALVAPANC
ncbi:hypothetical protein Ancab_005479 [Ancistrocladus abbreviatus]